MAHKRFWKHASPWLPLQPTPECPLEVATIITNTSGINQCAKVPPKVSGGCSDITKHQHQTKQHKHNSYSASNQLWRTRFGRCLPGIRCLKTRKSCTTVRMLTLDWISVWRSLQQCVKGHKPATTHWQHSLDQYCFCWVGVWCFQNGNSVTVRVSSRNSSTRSICHM